MERADEGGRAMMPVRRGRIKRVRALAAGVLALVLSGCSHLGYYLQSVGGQLEIWRRERPIEEVLADDATPQPLRRRLELVLRVREFASRELALPDNRSYRGYADIGRPYVVWNVFATEEFSVEPFQSCFMVVGCVSYRGYFSRAAAQRAAAGYARAGYDTYIAPVPAYSTLGWFPDPVLNTFVHYPEHELARLIFHELAHQVVYVRDDTEFNESFAVAVEREGVRRWLAAGNPGGRDAFERTQRVRGQFAALAREYRERLAALYRQPIAPAAMRERKRAILAQMRQEYVALREHEWGGYAGLDAWFGPELNNARLASVAIYNGLVPAFDALIAQAGGDLARFYGDVSALAALPASERNARLGGLRGTAAAPASATAGR